MIGFTAIMTLILKSIYKVIHFIIYALAHILIYFGLWIPAIYMIICGILMLTGGIDLSVMSINTIIFYVGLALTLLGSLIISIRHLILMPISQLVETEKAKKELKKRKAEEKKQKLYQTNPAKYYAIYGDDKNKSEEHSNDSPNNVIYAESAIKYPLIYRSKNSPNIIIHEYSNYFKVFKEFENGEIRLIDLKDKITNNVEDTQDCADRKTNKKRKRRK